MNDIVENEAPQKPLCLNCGEKMPRKATFCPHCGQRNNKGMVSMKELLRRFWSNFSHLDSKFVKMCWQLLIPGKVTAEYFAGRQKRYPHPVQFFFVVMFFFLLLFSKSIGNSNKGGVHLSSKSGGFNINGTTNDPDPELGKLDLFESLQRYVQSRKFRSAYDSLPVNWKTNTTRLADRQGPVPYSRQYQCRRAGLDSAQFYQPADPDWHQRPDRTHPRTNT
jgi:ribosomal protein L40E